MISKPSIVFWGTPDFVLPILDALLKQDYPIVGVVTTPEETPTKIFGQEHGIKVHQPESLKNPAKINLPVADLFVVAGYGKIIPREIIEKPKLGALVVHPSLLPRWRGPSPVQYSILNGEKETGVTIIKMDELMDHGPVVSQKGGFEIGNKSFLELNGELWKAAAELLAETLPKYLNGEISLVAQDDSKATFSKILKKDDGRIDWKKRAADIERMIRAFNPRPGTWTLLPTKDKILRVKIETSEAVDINHIEGSPGFIWQENSQAFVKTGSGSIEIKTITLEGKKPLDAASFVHGYAHFVGTTFV